MAGDKKITVHIDGNSGRALKNMVNRILDKHRQKKEDAGRAEQERAEDIMEKGISGDIPVNKKLTVIKNGNKKS